jgi:hypothetical protein
MATGLATLNLQELFEFENLGFTAEVTLEEEQRRSERIART